MTKPQQVPEEVVFTAEDIAFLHERSQHYFKETPGNYQLPGKSDTLTGSQLIALSWLMASTDLLHRKGCGTFVKPMLVEPTNEPSTEY